MNVPSGATAASTAAIRYKLIAEVADPGIAQACTTAMMEFADPPADAVTAFEQPGGYRVEAYYLAEPDPAAVASAIAPIVGMPKLTLTLEDVPDENWVAISQAALPPVEAGRFWVHGSHDRARRPLGPNSIEIEAGEAFGTAHHATTLGCLIAIDRQTRRRRYQRILDLGCGSGVLAIAAARAMPHARVTASDNDPEAVRVARANMAVNRAPAIRTVVANGIPRMTGTQGGRQTYDLLVANILAGPLIAMAGRIIKAVEPGGTLILSGILQRQAAAVRAAYHAHGMILREQTDLAGWSILTLTRRRTHPLLVRS